MDSEWFVIFLIPLLGSTLRGAVPLIFAALGGMFSERSGVINIALEGLMLCGAFAAAVGALTHMSPWAGLFYGMSAGILVAALYAYFVIELKSDQIVAGTGINILALGLTPFLTKILYDSTGSSPSIPLDGRFTTEPLWLALVVVCLIAFWFRYGASSLWVSCAGEHPEALSSAGISVRSVRWISVMISGALAGIGGATLSLFMSSSFSRNMTAGRGFMALAALIFGQWKPLPTTLACLFFGLTDALQAKLQGVSYIGANGSTTVPVQFIQILPYILTIGIIGGRNYFAIRNKKIKKF